MDSDSKWDAEQCEQMASQWWKEPWEVNHESLSASVAGFYRLWGGNITITESPSETAAGASSMNQRTEEAVATASSSASSEVESETLPEPLRLVRSDGSDQRGGQVGRDC